LTSQFRFITMSRILVVGLICSLIIACSDDPMMIDLQEEETVEVISGTFTKMIQHDGTDREYIIYIPESYDPNTKTPLLFNFHGFTSNAAEQMAYGDFRSIADTAGFLIVHPEGLRFNGQTHWNVGGWTVGSQVDDVGFTESLITEISNDYNVDESRIYATGMSNGGYMSFLLACQLSDRIAAIASVTGSMTPETFESCDPQHPMPILQVHGTSDPVVPYNGTVWSRSINDVMSYWATYNSCAQDATSMEISDINQSDGSTVESNTYPDCQNGVTTIHYKVEGGGHTWPGSNFDNGSTNYDVDASSLIWAFLSNYSMDDWL